MNIRTFSALVILIAFVNLNARVIVQGDSDATTGTSFSFNVFPFAASQYYTYIGRSSATDAVSSDDIRQYSVAGCQIGSSVFYPLAPEKIILNGESDQDNPLIGQQISTLGVFGNAPLIVTTANPGTLYWISNPTTAITRLAMVSLSTINDAQGNQTAGIVKLASSTTATFAAVKKSGGNFGEVGSGIALLGVSKDGIVQAAASPFSSVVAAAPFDGTQSFLTIGSDVTLDTSVVDMCWDDLLGRFYIACKATGGSGATDGAAAVAVGYLKMQTTTVGDTSTTSARLILNQILPLQLVTNDTTIVAGKGANTVASISKVRVMHTTTGLSYLIVQGNSSGTTPTRLVYALPLIDKSSKTSSSYLLDPLHGSVASKTIVPGVNPVAIYSVGRVANSLQRRVFQTVPSTTAELPVESDAAAQVGGGAAIGAIQDIFIYKDTVYVSTVKGTSDVAGVFYSEALFDEYGAIKGWTNWQRITSALDSTTNIYGLAFDANEGRCTTLQGSSTTTVDTVITTTWGQAATDGLLGGTTSDSTVGFNALLYDAFIFQKGMLSLFDFPKTTVGFSQTVGTRTSLVIALANQKMVLVETGQDNDDDYFIPRTGSFAGSDNKNFTNGTISSAPSSNTYMMSMSGGALTTLGSLTSVTIGKETTNGYGMYIIAGGTGGLGVLRASNGNGSADLQKSFNGLNGFSWVALGSYTNIRALQCDGQNLYVLTPNTFDRIPLSQLHGATLTPYTLATPTSLNLPPSGSFSDVAVSADCALLATSDGLYTTGAGGVVATGTTTADPLWALHSFTEGPLPVTRVVPLSTTGFSYDFARQTVGGQVLVLASSVGKKRSSIYRLTVADATGGVTSSTVQDVPDILLEGIVGPFAVLSTYRNFCATDGGYYLITRSKYLNQTGLINILPSDFGFLSPLIAAVGRHVVDIPFMQHPVRVGPVVRQSALGSWMVVTDTYLQILE